jgi:hypothetical protein
MTRTRTRTLSGFAIGEMFKSSTDFIITGGQTKWRITEEDLDKIGAKVKICPSKILGCHANIVPTGDGHACKTREHF